MACSMSPARMVSSEDPLIFPHCSHLRDDVVYRPGLIRHESLCLSYTLTLLEAANGNMKKLFGSIRSPRTQRIQCCDGDSLHIPGRITFVLFSKLNPSLLADNHPHVLVLHSSNFNSCIAAPRFNATISSSLKPVVSARVLMNSVPCSMVTNG